ncbi:hypothetical protein MNBD_PLANCTO02-268 [hydrothermal vent metagenome]|uniref:Uncharacterized protein n=1 Tax=hydrothermal vent metagenome TaxID=652676 RepID=A0A3B1DMB5_9ZZZZ
MNETVPSEQSLAYDILKQVEALLSEVEQEQKPLEVDPYRSRLFELFVTAEGAGYLDESKSDSLSAENLCRELSQCWGLDVAAKESVAQQEKMSSEQLSKMRLLWATMRMWMEWDYAWTRWKEFHAQGD